MEGSLEQFLHVLPEPSLLVSGTGEVLCMNSAAVEMCGMPPEEVVGGRFGRLVEDGEERVEEYLRLCSRSRQLLPGGFAWKRVNGPAVNDRCDGAVVVSKTETSAAVLFIRCRPKGETTDQFALLNQKIEALSKEILDRKKVELQRDEALARERRARLEAERESLMKDNFLATLSHELRTPLNAILGWTQLLRMTPDEETIKEGMEVIERNADVQRQLIEDLLDMSRIVSGKVRLDVQTVVLGEVIEAAVQSVRPAAEARNIRLQLTLDPIAGPVKGDPSRLQQIVWNLLSNAIKFTPKGGRVQVFLERVNSHVEITVSDTGEGIRPDFLPHVFDRFRQADASITRRHGGMGLGLSIVKQLAELHGGTVRAKSPGVGQGATFVVVLPLMVLHGEGESGVEKSHPATERRESKECEGIDLKGIRVLAVDDEPDARELVRRFLSGCGAMVFCAGSAIEGLGMMREVRPDVIISDIGMPEMDGFEFIRRVRSLKREEGGKAPALALSAFARTEDRTRAMHAGFNMHLSKPLDAMELVTIVGSLCGRIGG